MLEIKALTDKDLKIFGEFFEDYYKELGCDEDCGHSLRNILFPTFWRGF